MVHYVDHGNHEGVMYVVDQIDTSHKYQSPNCQNAIRDIRIVAVIEQQRVGIVDGDQ